MGQLFEPKHNFLGQITNKKSIGQIMFVKKFVDIFVPTPVLFKSFERNVKVNILLIMCKYQF